MLPSVVLDACVRCGGGLLVFIVALNSRHTCYPATNLFISPAARLSVGGCLCQQDTDVKDRLLRKRCLKCDYNQMCMQIITEAADFAISHRCMLSETLFTCCCQETIINHLFIFSSASWPNETLRGVMKSVRWNDCCRKRSMKIYGLHGCTVKSFFQHKVSGKKF